MTTDQVRVFRAKTAGFERAVKAAAWPDPVTRELALGLARLLDGSVRTDNPELFFDAADRLQRLLVKGGPRESQKGGASGGAVAGFVGAGPEVRDPED